MLREVNKTRQIADEPLRRWFAGHKCDILVWMSEEGVLWGGEFRYPRPGSAEPDALLRWDRRGGVKHHLIDFGSGEGNGFKMSALYGPVVPCDVGAVLEIFESELDGKSDPILKDITAVLRVMERRGI